MGLKRLPTFAAAPVFPAAVFVVTLAVLVVAVDVTTRAMPSWRGPGPTTEGAERPANHYLATDINGQFDHDVIYFGLSREVLDGLRAADVLFLGNSRLLFALRPEVLRPYFDGIGARYYVMGFGYREADEFPLTVIRKFDLRPRLVVVNSDGFFGGGMGVWGEVVDKGSRFEARKRQLEGEVTHASRRLVERLVPNWLHVFGLPGLPLRRGFISYRSREDGTWAISPWADGTEAFAPPPIDGPELSRGEIDAARAFKAELDARGSRLVLTRVPTPAPMNGGGPARFADLLGVPLVTVEVSALSTHDHSHLTAASAFDWSRAFVDALAPYARGFEQRISTR